MIRVDLLVWLRAVCLLALLHSPADAACPNLCSGHGACTSSNTCECTDLYSGLDCSMREYSLPYFAQAARGVARSDLILTPTIIVDMYSLLCARLLVGG